MPSVYVIGHDEPPYKIGHSSNPKHRLADLQVAHYSQLELLAEARMVSGTRKAEAALHEALAPHRVGGEWFDCPLDVILNAASDLAIPLVPYEPETISLSAEGFRAWLTAMQAPPYNASNAECGRLLGVSANSIVAMKQRGTDRRTALACRALFHRLEPWG